MDELVIGDKKYVSSKRAAEITGYAKDYIGQLCREGRVEARLVGRSWYVLDSAIQDHRFGRAETVIPQNTKQNKAIFEESQPFSYKSEPVIPIEKVLPRQEETPKIEAVWQEWFSKKPEIDPVEPAEVIEEPKETAQVPEEAYFEDKDPDIEPATEEEAPIELEFTKMPEENADLSYEAQNEPVRQVPAQTRTKKGSKGYYALRAILLLLSVSSILLALVGSGKINSAALVFVPNSLAGVTAYSSIKN